MSIRTLNKKTTDYPYMRRIHGNYNYLKLLESLRSTREEVSASKTSLSLSLRISINVNNYYMFCHTGIFPSVTTEAEMYDAVRL